MSQKETYSVKNAIVSTVQRFVDPNLILLFCLSMSFSLGARADLDIAWQTVMGSKNPDEFKKMAVSKDGEIAVVSFNNLMSDVSDYMLYRISPAGELLAEQRIGGDEMSLDYLQINDSGSSLLSVKTGGAPGSGRANFQLTQFDNNLKAVKSREFPMKSGSYWGVYPISISQYSVLYSNWLAFLNKPKEGLEIKDVQRLVKVSEVAGEKLEVPLSVAKYGQPIQLSQPTNKGELFLITSKELSHWIKVKQFSILKLAKNGSIDWDVEIVDSNNFMKLVAVRPDSSGGVFLLINAEPKRSGYYGPAIYRLIYINSQGKIEFNKLIKEFEYAAIEDMHVDSGILFAGSVESTGLIAQLDLNGENYAEMLLPRRDGDYIYLSSISQDEEGSIYTAGEISGMSRDVLMVKLAFTESEARLKTVSRSYVDYEKREIRKAATFPVDPDQCTNGTAWSIPLGKKFKRSYVDKIIETKEMDSGIKFITFIPKNNAAPDVEYVVRVDKKIGNRVLGVDLHATFETSELASQQLASIKAAYQEKGYRNTSRSNGYYHRLESDISIDAMLLSEIELLFYCEDQKAMERALRKAGLI